MMHSYFVQNPNDRFEVTQVEDDWLIVNLNDFSITKLDQLAGLCFSMLTEAQSLDMLVESVLSNDFLNEDFEALKTTVREQVEVLLSHNLIYYVH